MLCNFHCILLFAYFQRILPTPADGAPCSGMVGEQHPYSVCRELLRVNSTTGRRFDNSTDSAFFNYKHLKNGHTHQVWMDDPETLLAKYDLANSFQLRGIGMWHADSLDYSANASAEVQQDTLDMWNAMHRFKMN
jgi:Di-N-acetylchitobiase